MTLAFSVKMGYYYAVGFILFFLIYWGDIGQVMAHDGEVVEKKKPLFCRISKILGVFCNWLSKTLKCFISLVLFYHLNFNSCTVYHH